MAYLRIVDDRRRELIFSRPPARIVSLVPSDTLNVFALGRTVVGRTRYCEAPAEIAVVGGTKDVDVDAVAALEPDLILANQEENSRVHLEQLAQRGWPVLIAFPRTVAEGLSHLARLARVLAPSGTASGGAAGIASARKLIAAGLAMHEEAEAAVRTVRPLRVFVPIWMDPLMTINGQTFISDALRLAGCVNVFADRERRFPLAADLGEAIPTRAGSRDTRYPRITLAEVVERKPEVVLLPDEPHPFSSADAEVFRKALPNARIVFCGGRDLSWYGAQSIEGIPRLRKLVDTLR
ncbi:MAG TPA: helical backbone metal receptor [Myxococcales bacterium]|jgi:ABC-type Fe3+-hydroxamate transport system substrate-binding protein